MGLFHYFCVAAFLPTSAGYAEGICNDWCDGMISRSSSSSIRAQNGESNVVSNCVQHSEHVWYSSSKRSFYDAYGSYVGARTDSE